MKQFSISMSIPKAPTRTGVIHSTCSLSSIYSRTEIGIYNSTGEVVPIDTIQLPEGDITPEMIAICIKRCWWNTNIPFEELHWEGYPKTPPALSVEWGKLSSHVLCIKENIGRLAHALLHTEGFPSVFLYFRKNKGK